MSRFTWARGPIVVIAVSSVPDFLVNVRRRSLERVIVEKPAESGVPAVTVTARPDTA